MLYLYWLSKCYGSSECKNYAFAGIQITIVCPYGLRYPNLQVDESSCKNGILTASGVLENPIVIPLTKKFPILYGT
jgi:hypothetical protein